MSAGRDFSRPGQRAGGHPGRVSLMLKACAQDGRFIEQLVRHVVHQLGDVGFVERYLVVDTKPGAFLRQYAPPTPAALRNGLDRLVVAGLLDYWYEAPAAPETARDLNLRWFACDTAATHSSTGVPIAPHLHGFERAKGDYLLQADIDVLIGRRDPYHDYLSDMLFALDSDERHLSVSFNIPHSHSAYIPYSAPPGGFVPEVRFGLIDLRKLRAALPLPNSVEPDGALELTWYRSLQKKQQQSDLLSIRGGDGRSFYIHPMNSFKATPEDWMMVLRQVEAGNIPEVQFEKHDLVEDRLAWESATGDPYERLILSPHELLDQPALRQGNGVTPGLLALRHGAKEFNAGLSGAVALDSVNVSDVGVEEVVHFGRHLPVRPKRILCSPLRRCQQTARILAEHAGGQPEVVVVPELLGAPFPQREEWQRRKGHLGWSLLVARWMNGEVPRACVVPYEEWLPEALAAIQRSKASEGWTIMVTQGYLNSAFCHHLTERIEYRGGALHGFAWPQNGN
jgi:hypothetical protein